MSTTPFRLARSSMLQVWLAIGLMLTCLAGTELLKPRRYSAEVTGEPDLERLIPKEFGDWVQSNHGGNRIVNPQEQAALNALYGATLNRTYIHKPTGRVLMLSLAYGKDQSLATQIHTPEACYPSQGFRVNERDDVVLATRYGALKSVRLNTSLGLRIEPLTYFVRAGDVVARGSFERNMVRLRYAARGYLPDGMLFRISEITNRPDVFDLQTQFINDLLTATPPATRMQLIGSSRD